MAPRRTKRTGDPTKVVAYIRVSTEEQRNGPEVQRAALDAWCQQQGAEVVAVHEDLGVSGGAPLEARPGLAAAVDAVCSKGAGVLLAHKRDRIGRDVLVTRLIEKAVERCGARLQTVEGGNGDSPSDRFTATILDAAAEHERALIRARTKAALQAKKARGERVGQVPYGWAVGTDGVRLVPNEREQKTLIRMQALRRQGLSLRNIADALGTKGARGKRWHHTSVKRALDNLEERRVR